MIETLGKILEKMSHIEGIALRDINGELTFGQLYERSFQSAILLRSRGVNRSDRVAILAEKSTIIFPYLFGCMLIGATFCPVDDSAAANRISSMLEDIDPKLFIVGNKTRSIDLIVEKYNTCGVLNIESPPDIGELTIEAPFDLYPDEVAYIIFTSGSTGRPKGVQITQRNLAAFLHAFGDRYGKDNNFNYLSLGPLYFDMTILDCFVPLAYGNSVFLYSMPLVPSLFATIVTKYNINCFSAVPSVLNQLLTNVDVDKQRTKLAGIKMVLLGAEHIADFVKVKICEILPFSTIINAYGPTEHSVCCFSHEMRIDEFRECKEIPIGTPFRDVKCLVKTETGWKTEGTGSLFLGGPQLMKGYLKRDSENASRFQTIDGEVYYDTGDVVSYCAGGLSYFKGRDDDEVKINGFRVHLLDITHNLADVLNDIEFSVFKIKLVEKDAIAVVVQSKNETSLRQKASQLKECLPSYMLPKIWAMYDKIPSLSNGKINRIKVANDIDVRIQSGSGKGVLFFRV